MAKGVSGSVPNPAWPDKDQFCTIVHGFPAQIYETGSKNHVVVAIASESLSLNDDLRAIGDAGFEIAYRGAFGRNRRGLANFRAHIGGIRKSFAILRAGIAPFRGIGR